MSRRIMIIDDDDTSMFLYKHHFRGFPGVEIIAEFDNAEEALAQINQLKPDVVIVDYKLPGMSGIEFAERVSQYPEIRILLVTGHDRDYFKSMMKNPLKFDIVKKDWSEKTIEHIFAFCK
ncbi:MAG: response regulator transcription factor [Chitinivibrionales bacterium]